MDNKEFSYRAVMYSTIGIVLIIVLMYFIK